MPVTTANAATSCFHLLGTQNNWREAAKNPPSWQPGTVTIPAGSPSIPAALQTLRTHSSFHRHLQHVSYRWSSAKGRRARCLQHDASPDATAHTTLRHQEQSSSVSAVPAPVTPLPAQPLVRKTQGEVTRAAGKQHILFVQGPTVKMWRKR